ncbi:hypothetical protein [Kitasatospora purpeofusca]|uniref:hypothetical protein n=1 Tax=Kitasatospora purpeofusca TaxID=67352 RepID=UPI0035DD05BC
MQSRNRPRTAGAPTLRHAYAWVAAVVVALLAAITCSALATADTPQPTDNSAAPPAVEDFSYPGAASLNGVKVLRGDGRITLTDCSGPSQIQIWTRAPVNGDGKLCFAAGSATGRLTLELSEVFYIQTSGRAVRAGLTADGNAQNVDIAKDGYRVVGEGLGQTPTTAVELTVTG